jgi:hemolysin-activating ACP:hemolysin acyltransferase
MQFTNASPPTANVHAHQSAVSAEATHPSPNKIEWLCPSLTSSAFDPMAALGMATWLWSQSPLHADWPSKLLARSIWPAIVHRQFMLGRDPDRQPVAYVSWACLNEERERQYLRSPSSLAQDDWVSGDRIWFVDWIAPWGGTRAGGPQDRTRHLPRPHRPFPAREKGPRGRPHQGPLWQERHA